MDTGGKFGINPEFDSGASFVEGLAAVRSGNAWGFIDKKGKLVIPAQFQDPGPMPMQFSEGLAAAIIPREGRHGMQVGYIDKNGRVAIAPQFVSAAPFSNSLALVASGGRCVYSA